MFAAWGGRGSVNAGACCLSCGGLLVGLHAGRRECQNQGFLFELRLAVTCKGVDKNVKTRPHVSSYGLPAAAGGERVPKPGHAYRVMAYLVAARGKRGCHNQGMLIELWLWLVGSFKWVDTSVKTRALIELRLVGCGIGLGRSVKTGSFFELWLVSCVWGDKCSVDAGACCSS